MDKGTILTSIIGASAATIGVVVAKDSRISEFRQQWINALRDDVAKLCSASVALYHGNIRYSAQECLRDLKPVDTDSLVEQANNLGYRIRLRLDKRKPHSQELIGALDALVNIASNARDGFDATNRCVEVVLEKTDVVIEDAWRNVKKGEKRFRWTFRIALVSLVIALASPLTLWLWQRYHW